MKSSKIKQPVPWIHRSCWVQDSSSVYLLFSRRDGEKSWKLWLDDAEQRQPMWLCILSGRRFEDTFEQWRKIKQMQPVWLCILLCKRFEETYEKAQWRKVQQMQPMWFCIFLCKCFEDTFEKRTLVKSWTDFRFKNTVEKSRTNATDVAIPLLRQAI